MWGGAKFTFSPADFGPILRGAAWGGRGRNTTLRHQLIVVLALVAILAPSASAGDSSFSPLADFRADAGTPRVRPVRPADGRPALLDGRLPIQAARGELDRMEDLGSVVVREFPLADGALVDLELLAFDPIAPDALFVVVEGDQQHVVPPPSMRYFRGRIVGEPDSLAYLWIYDGRLGGFVGRKIADPAERKLHLFGPRSARLETAESREFVVTIGVGKSKEAGPYCGTDALDPFAGLSGAPAPRSGWMPSSTTLLKAEIAVDSTFEYFSNFGSVPSAQVYATSLMGAVSTIYESNVLCQMTLKYFRTFTTNTDPYASGGSTNTLLNQLGTEWTTNPALTPIQRTVTHLFHKEAGMGGLASLNVLCNTTNGYGVSALDGIYTYPNAGYTWDADVVSHELGHNFGSPHTHCYVPPIDQCFNTEPGCYSGTVVPSIGTIMSYCHLVMGKTLVFSQRERDVIRPRIEAAACIVPAGSPGDIRAAASQLKASKATVCGSASLSNDDNDVDSASAYGGTAQAAWVKRFTPSCYPFQLQKVEVLVWQASVAVGRSVRILVYSDPSGGTTPAAATLVSSQDVTIQSVSSTIWNSYTLATPVTVASGTLFIGVFDLVPDASDTFIMSFDTSRSGDSFRQANDTAPAGYGAFASGTWMIRGTGGCVNPDCVKLTWGLPCNDVTVPGQDFGIYQGTIGNWSSRSSVVCTTGKNLTYNWAVPASNVYWVVVPNNNSNEGAYGGTLVPAVGACKPQQIGACP